MPEDGQYDRNMYGLTGIIKFIVVDSSTCQFLIRIVVFRNYLSNSLRCRLFLKCL